MSLKHLLVIVGLSGICVGMVLYYREHSTIPSSVAATSQQTDSLVINQENLERFDNIVPVAIIGSGPAGLSSALYTARMGIYTVVFKGSMAGGQLMGTSDIENWPGTGIQNGPVLMKNFEDHVQSFGAHFVTQNIKRVDISTWPYRLWTDEGTQIHALSVIIASGAYPRHLGVPGEEQYWGKGVSSCAICDAPFYKDKVVVVVGGGDSAAEEAMELARFAKNVIVLVRAKAMRASQIMQTRMREYPNIEVRFNTQVSSIEGDGSRVTHVMLAQEHNAKSSLTVDGLFLGIGHIPNTQIFKDFVACDANDYIVLNGNKQATSKPGVFAAGDVADAYYRQAGVAAGDGIKAALECSSFLHTHGLNDVLKEFLKNRYYQVATSETDTVQSEE